MREHKSEEDKNTLNVLCLSLQIVRAPVLQHISVMLPPHAAVGGFGQPRQYYADSPGTIILNHVRIGILSI